VDLKPEDPSAVADAVRTLRAHRGSATVVGGATLTDVADPAPSSDVLSTTALDDIVRYEPADLTLTCGSGVTLAALNAALEVSSQTLPLWHPAPERATIGGLVAFGWTGLGRTLYGPLRDRVLEVHAVTGAGRAVRGGGKVVKNVTGFDLPRLFCGSMGTLGVLVELTLKVQPEPEPLHGVVVHASDPVSAAEMARRTLDEVRMPVEALLCRASDGWRLEVFAPGPSTDAETLLAPFGGEPVEEADARFDAIARAPVLAGGSSGEVGVKIAVPPSAVAELCGTLRGADEAVVDVGSGLVWATVEVATAADARALVERAGGTLVLQRAPADVRRRLGTWGTPPATLEIMARLRDSFDPDRVLNPGRFVV